MKHQDGNLSNVLETPFKVNCREDCFGPFIVFVTSIDRDSPRWNFYSRQEFSWLRLEI